jgi:uncharacterized membrane protein
MVLIKKRRNNSGCFTDIPEPELFGLLAPPGRNDATNFYVNFMKDFRQSGTKVWVNYVIAPPDQNASSSSSTSLDTVIDNVAAKTKNMDSDQFEKEIIKAKMVCKDKRSMDKSLLVPGTANLKAIRKNYEESMQAFMEMKR